MNAIELENIVIHAYHGCLKEEELIGSDFRIDLMVEYDFSHTLASDDIADTIDYDLLNRIVHRQMTVRARLIETVACRIFEEIKETFPGLGRIRIRLAKINPPLEGNVFSAAVTIDRKL